MKNTPDHDMVNGNSILILSQGGGMLLCVYFNEQRLCFTEDIWSEHFG